LPAALLRTLLLVLLALTIVVSLQTVGVGLVAAMLVTPAATAYLLARRLSTMMAISGGVGILSSVIGLYLSYYVNVASGAAIVLTCTVFFALAFLFAPGKGLVWRLRAEKPHRLHRGARRPVATGEYRERHRSAGAHTSGRLLYLCQRYVTTLSLADQCSLHKSHRLQRLPGGNRSGSSLEKGDDALQQLIIEGYLA